VQLHHLWLSEFRSYSEVELELPSGLTAVLGQNGQGKSNLLEAVGYLATLRSFRGAPSEALVRVGADRAVVRGEVTTDGRDRLVEAEIARTGRNRVLLDKQRLSRQRDLLEAVRVTVFAPDDLELVKGGPALRRAFLDDLLVSLHPRHDAVRAEWERALKQRNALLKQIHGRPDESALLTLEVWDQKLSAAGEELARLRAELTERLAPTVTRAYRDVADEELDVGLRYTSAWRGPDGTGGLAAALLAARDDELRRGITLVGPHRDDLELTLRGLPARTHASQGEQRSLALAMRLASHRALLETHGSPPVLLLDDVFSELDESRSAALLRSLPEGQTLLSSAAGLPEGVDADLVLHVADGRVHVA
jgi:DNA replication and repair protein RecF